MRIDVILLLYNRPEHTEEVLKGICDNGISRIRAYLDYSDIPDVQIQQQQIIKIINDFRDHIDIELIEREEKYGLAKSVRTSLTEVFNDGADGAILLEDDCVLKKGGYSFFKQGLERLKENRKIRSLCGYTYPSCNFIFDPDSDLLLLSRFSTWGWATWADRWVQYEQDLSKLVKATEMALLDIDDFASDISMLCKSEKFLSGKADIWSINWILLHYITSTFAVYPREPVIDNIGLDGSGANCVSTSIFETNNNGEIYNQYNWKKLQYYPENETIIKKFMARHGLKTYPTLT